MTVTAAAAVALPVLPDRGFGPYAALNPHTCEVSLAI